MSNLLAIAKSGLDASRKALKTTGHNIANVNTEGYSRQRVNQVTNPPIETQGNLIGSGVRVKGVDRIADPYIEKRLNKATSDTEYFDARANKLAEVEMIFNDLDGEGLHKVMNDFFNSFRELANQPENETIRSVVRDKANLVVKDIRRIRETLDDISNGIDSRVHHDVDTINTILNKISKLNVEIARLEAGEDETGDLRDQRDLAVRQLSEFFSVNTYVEEDGSYMVNAVGVGTIVAGKLVQELSSAATNKDESTNGMEGAREVFFDSRKTLPLTKKFKGGGLSSMLKVRNEDIVELKKRIDRIAFEFSNAVNAIHNRGYVARNVEVNAEGRAPAFDQNGPTTGINFFEEIRDVEGASMNLRLSEDVKNDLNNITTALAPNSPGDNRIAVAISKLQHEKFLEGGTTSLEDSYLSMVGKVGLEAGKAKMNLEQSEGLLAQAKSLRERLSGVSIDEETANLIRYQQAYDASAKVMQTADEMFQTILTIKR